jgi:hypothetical protein
MIDFSASIAVQQVTRSAAFNARPDAPIRPDDAPIAQRAGAIAARQRLGEWLRRLADVVQPVGAGTVSPLPTSR